MDKFFKLSERNTDVKTEVIAGITTFLAMAYIFAVNPAMLADAGMNSAAVFTATVVSAAFATLCMAFFANYPVALASGMGLNAYFTYSVCVPMAQAGIQNPYEIALTAILVEGFVFIILSLFKFRETLVNTIPKNLKLGISAGIGLFITLVALKGAGIVVADQSTLVTMGDLSQPSVVLCIVGLLAIGFFQHKKVPGAILIGILLTWVLGMLAQVIGWYQVNPEIGAYSLFPDFSNWSVIPAKPYAFSFNFGYVASHVWEFVIIVFSFLFVDIFDTVGTLIGVANKGGLTKEDGTLPQVGGALMADAVGTVAGACLGTSTVTSYVESCAGIAAGGRTGLTSVVTAILMLFTLLLSPIFLAIPGFATAPALIYVGLLMMSQVKNMDFEGDIADSIGGFLALIAMPFTYSVANGIMFGMLSWIILKVCFGKFKDIHPVMWISGALFAIRIITMIV